MTYPTPEKRREILTFYGRFGLEATQAAYGVSRATLFRWKARDRTGFLGAESRAPVRVRVSVWSEAVLSEVERLRWEHPRIGKRKITPLLRLFCLEQGYPLPSEATVGRMVGHLVRRRRIPDPRRYSWYARQSKWRLTRVRPVVPKVRRNGYTPQRAGDLVAMDTVALFSGSVRRYIVTAIDYSSSFAFAYTYKTLSSRTATDFLEKLRQVAPFEVWRVQTDNGQEFARHFHAALKEAEIVHFHTYPRRPQMNGKLERFNRTVQEEFSEHHWQTLVTDLERFNVLLMEWLVWYNAVRPHEAIKLQSPLQYLVRNEDLSHMLWTCTDS